MKKDILGIKIDDVNMEQALNIVEKWIWNPGKHYIVTPNPEIIVAAQKDGRYKKLLNDADLSIPDGIGLKLSGRIKNTVPGTDLMEKLIELAAEKGFVVGFLGGRGDVAQETAECLLQKYPNLKISYISSGGIIDNHGKPQEVVNPHNTNYIIPTDILFVAFGPPKQERWIADNLDKIPVKVAMGVGGAFDYLSGKVPRAPKWLRYLGLEWMFRLIIQPWRIKRQISLLKYLWLTVLS